LKHYFDCVHIWYESSELELNTVQRKVNFIGLIAADLINAGSVKLLMDGTFISAVRSIINGRWDMDAEEPSFSNYDGDDYHWWRKQNI
jgi:hypothetical protein